MRGCMHQLIVSNCPDLTILLLVHPISAVSFSCLKELDITECHGLNYLFTSSLAMKLMHLEKIKVKNCNTMTRIVERDNTLERLKLEQLSKLYSSKFFI
ncbi:unnamed protein product [Trifolium pratense]|uniref:Uncharacterized protein n=1 Tax=Trifolium pratense TaxID=57577 RepID=A0ACB0IVH7_TRIPR|nr:unnamed protein product [Trifolium pratense]